MAGKQNEPNEKETKAVQTGNLSVKANRQEDVYTMEDFAQNSTALFGVRREIVVAAFHDKKITTATKEEAKKIIEGFKKREVK